MQAVASPNVSHPSTNLDSMRAIVGVKIATYSEITALAINAIKAPKEPESKTGPDQKRWWEAWTTACAIANSKEGSKLEDLINTGKVNLIQNIFGNKKGTAKRNKTANGVWLNEVFSYLSKIREKEVEILVNDPGFDSETLFKDYTAILPGKEYTFSSLKSLGSKACANIQMYMNNLEHTFFQKGLDPEFEKIKAQSAILSSKLKQVQRFIGCNHSYINEIDEIKKVRMELPLYDFKNDAIGLFTKVFGQKAREYAQMKKDFGIVKSGIEELASQPVALEYIKVNQWLTVMTTRVESFLSDLHDCTDKGKKECELSLVRQLAGPLQPKAAEQIVEKYFVPISLEGELLDQPLDERGKALNTMILKGLIWCKAEDKDDIEMIFTVRIIRLRYLNLIGEISPELLSIKACNQMVRAFHQNIEKYRRMLVPTKGELLESHRDAYVRDALKRAEKEESVLTQLITANLSLQPFLIS